MSRLQRGPFVHVNTKILTAAGNFTIINDSTLIVNKTVGQATSITLPKSVITGQQCVIKDGKGDAGTNNITVFPDGATVTTIDGAANKIIAVNYGWIILEYNGTEWNVISQGISGSSTALPTFATLQQLPVGAGTITVTALNPNVICDCTAGSTTATTLAAGTYDGQPLQIVNQNSTNVIGFNGTDSVALLGSASSVLIFPKKARRFVWNAANALWYEEASVDTSANLLPLLGSGTITVGSNTQTVAPAASITFLGQLTDLIVTGSVTGTGALNLDSTANIMAAISGAQKNERLRLRVLNNSSVTLTVAAGDASTTLQGAASIGTLGWRDFDLLVTNPSLTNPAITITNAGAGTYHT